IRRVSVASGGYCRVRRKYFIRHTKLNAGCGVNASSDLEKRTVRKPDKARQRRIRRLLPDAV
ncbi:hypothetical protein, partial [Escherichia sp. TW14182]|uniref:hypothetical protein n=1 Tax=Escherichia sp. TW14182 TaxID=754336 RepID=UPI001ED8D3ED